jgi:hypothetical protein
MDQRYGVTAGIWYFIVALQRFSVSYDFFLVLILIIVTFSEQYSSYKNIFIMRSKLQAINHVCKKKALAVAGIVLKKS